MFRAGHRWLTPGILRKQRSGGSRCEASRGKQFVKPYLEELHHKKRAGEVAKGSGPEFKPQNHTHTHTHTHTHKLNFKCLEQDVKGNGLLSG
jgi:hypothetical protein